MVNNIRNNTISEIDAKKDLNALNEIKNVEIIKYKKRTPGHKKLLNLFNKLLNIILTDKTSESQENEKVESRKEENEDYENEDEDYKYENEDEDYEYENENENEDESMSQKKIKNLNDNLDEIIDKSKLFEDQIESLKKIEDLKEHFPYKDFGDKELKSKYFKIQLADMSNEIDEKLFELIFGHKLETLANKLINTTNKDENQIIINNINKNNDKLYEKHEYNDWVIQAQQCSDLKYIIDLILNFNKTIQLDLV